MALKQWINLALLGLVWGTSFLWIKIAEYEVGPLTLVAWRLLFGSFCILTYVILKRTTIKFHFEDLGNLFLLALLNPGATFVLIAWSEKFVDSAVVSILNATGPLITILLAHRFLQDERITIQRLIGLIVGFFGVLILVTREQDLTVSIFQKGVIGHLMVLGAMLGLAGGAVFARQRLKHTKPLLLTLIPMIIATVLTWPSALLIEGPLVLKYDLLTWVALLWLGVLGSGLALFLYFSLVSNVGPTRTNLVSYLSALVGVSVGVIVLQEQFDFSLLLGGFLILGAITIVNRI